MLFKAHLLLFFLSKRSFQNLFFDAFSKSSLVLVHLLSDLSYLIIMQPLLLSSFWHFIFLAWPLSLELTLLKFRAMLKLYFNIPLKALPLQNHLAYTTNNTKIKTHGIWSNHNFKSTFVCKPKENVYSNKLSFSYRNPAKYQKKMKIDNWQLYRHEIENTHSVSVRTKNETAFERLDQEEDKRYWLHLLLINLSSSKVMQLSAPPG